MTDAIEFLLWALAIGVGGIVAITLLVVIYAVIVTVMGFHRK